MPQFEYSRWDGSQEFSPQSADRLFDQISEYLLHYGDDAMPAFEEWGEENPELLEMLNLKEAVTRSAFHAMEVLDRRTRVSTRGPHNHEHVVAETHVS